MEDKAKSTEGLPEAAASATVKIKSPAGYEYLFTMRSNSSKDLLFKMNAMEKHFIENNFTPLSQGNQFPPKFPKKEIEYVEGRACPVCSSKLVYATTKAGKKFIKCSTNKYDFATKTVSGCQYVSWDELDRPEIPFRDIKDEY